jgi:hypothetical protein
MTANERRSIFLLTLILIGSVLWFAAELGWIDRDGETDLVDWFFGGTTSQLPAWEVAIVQMANKLFPGVAIVVLFALTSIAYQSKERKDE